MPELEVRGVSRRFGDFDAVSEVSFTVESGEFFTLLGPSGCGKTTLLRLIAGFDRPDAGQLLLNGRDLADTPAERRPIHTVFQSLALFPHLTVAGNVAFPLRMAKVPAAQQRPRVQAALEQVHLEPLAEHYPHELSGGQRQRVALARALVDRPQVLLLDEALGSLDLKLREEMRLELIKLQREVGITFIFVTHDQPEAMALSHRIAVMQAGRIEQLDAPARVYGFPRNRFVADFIGDCNLLDAKVRAATDTGLTLDIAGLGPVRAPASALAQPGARGVLALRPEQLRLAPAGAELNVANRFAGTVQEVLYIGDATSYKVMVAEGALLSVLLPNAAPGPASFFAVGESVHVGWPAESGHYVRD